MSKRILDESTTTTIAADDYLYIDGTTNGSRIIKPDSLVAASASITTLQNSIAALATLYEDLNKRLEDLEALDILTLG